VPAHRPSPKPPTRQPDRLADVASALWLRRRSVLTVCFAVFFCLAQMDFASRAIGQDADVLSAAKEASKAAKPGSVFKECATGCPVMIVIPPGKFMMGSPQNEPDREAGEGPQHEVTGAEPFAVSKCEVTFAEWDACVAASACPGVADGWGRGQMPVINVTWYDAKQYVAWLSQLTGKEYRLLTEAEWETRHGPAPAPAIPGAMLPTLIVLIVTAAAAIGISSKPRRPDRSRRTHSGFTIYTAMSGSGLRTPGTRTTTVHQATRQRGYRAATTISASSAVALGATRAHSYARPSASNATFTSDSTRSACESRER
jgi:hypothetical protein